MDSRVLEPILWDGLRHHSTMGNAKMLCHRDRLRFDLKILYTSSSIGGKGGQRCVSRFSVIRVKYNLYLLYLNQAMLWVCEPMFDVLV